MDTQPAPGELRSLDHTADVGLEVDAPTLGALFLLAARGMTRLIRGDEGWAGPRDGPRSGIDASTPRSLTLTAADPATLLRDWLRELLFWHETEGLSFHGASFDVIDEHRLDASVSLTPDTAPPVREIKGVTLHGLRAERSGAGWTGQVIFDV